MNFNLICSIVINGLAMGMIYAMIAMGLILLIKAVGILNFAQGDLLMFGTYIASTLIVDKAMSAIVWVPLALVIWAFVGIVFMFSTYWPLRNASYSIAPIVATMGASMVLSEGTLIIWGAWPRNIPAIVRDAAGNAATINLFGSKIQVQFFITIALGALIMYLVYVLTEKLYIGKMMRAAAQDKYAAQLVGIPPMLTTMFTYALVTCLVGSAGYMVAPLFAVTPALAALQLKAFAGTVIGGFGSIKGAIVGCILIGIVEAFATVNMSVYKDAVVFLTLICFLIFFPGGIIKTKIKEKA